MQRRITIVDALWSLMYFALVYFGIYSLYIAYKMKNTGEILGKIFLIHNTKVDRCKDKESYITFMYPKILVFGIFATLMGGVGVIDSYFLTVNAFLTLGVAIIFSGTLIWLTRSAKKASKDFW